MRPNLYSGHLRVAVFPDCLAKIRQQSSCRCFHVEKRHFLVPTPGSEAGYRQGKGAALYFEHFMCSWDSGTSGPIVFPVRDCLTMLPRRKTSFSGSRPRARFREAGSRQGMVLHFVSSIFCAPSTREPRVHGSSGLSNENSAAIELQVLRCRKTPFPVPGAAPGSEAGYRRGKGAALFRVFSVLPALGNLGSQVFPDCLTKIRRQSSCRCFHVEKRHFPVPTPSSEAGSRQGKGAALYFEHFLCSRHSGTSELLGTPEPFRGRKPVKPPV